MPKEIENKKEDEEKPEEGGDSLTIPPEILKHVPQGERPKFLREVSMFLSMTRHGSSSDIFANKINSSHIDKIIDSVGADNRRKYQFAVGQRKFNFALIFVMIIVIVGLMVFFALRNESELLKQILIGIALIIGGVGGGYGYSKR